MARKKPTPKRQRLQYSDRERPPTNWLRFVQLSPFERAWKELKLDDNALRALELTILADPTSAPVEPDTGGLRKLRFAPASWGSGRSGAARVYYVHFVEKGIILLVHAYRKSHEESLSKQERMRIRKLIDEVQQLFEDKPAADD